MDGGPEWIAGPDRRAELTLQVFVAVVAFVGSVGWFAAGGSVWLLFVAMGAVIWLGATSAGLTAARQQRRRAYRVSGTQPGSLDVRDLAGTERSYPLEQLQRVERRTANRPRDEWWTLVFEGGAEVTIQGGPGGSVVGLVRARRPDVVTQERPLGDGGGGGS